MIDDLPTPPLPEAMSRHAGAARRVGEGDRAAFGVAVARAGTRRWRPGRRAELSRTAARCSSVITPKRTSTWVGSAVRRPHGGTRWSISLRSGQPAMVRSMSHRDRGAVDVDVADHAEVDDRAVQLGVFDGAERVDDIGFGEGHANSFRISPTRIVRIPTWTGLS